MRLCNCAWKKMILCRRANQSVLNFVAIKRRHTSKRWLKASSNMCGIYAQASSTCVGIHHTHISHFYYDVRHATHTYFWLSLPSVTRKWIFQIYAHIYAPHIVRINLIVTNACVKIRSDAVAIYFCWSVCIHIPRTKSHVSNKIISTLDITISPNATKRYVYRYI